MLINTRMGGWEFAGVILLVAIFQNFLPAETERIIIVGCQLRKQKKKINILCHMLIQTPLSIKAFMRQCANF